TPGNVCRTVMRAPGVTPRPSSRAARPSAPARRRIPTTTPRDPSPSADSGRTPSELNAKAMEGIVQSRPGEDGDRRDHAEDREPRPEAALAHHHQKVGHAWNEERHHRERDNRLHAGELTAVRQLKESRRSVIAPQK